MNLNRPVVVQGTQILPSMHHSSIEQILKSYLATLKRPKAGFLFPVFLTTDEAADFLRVSRRSLEALRLANRGPRFFRLGKGQGCRVIYSLVDLATWIDQYARDTPDSGWQRL